MTCFPKKQAWIQVLVIQFACSLFIWSHFKAVSCAFMFWGLLVLSKLMECFLFYIIFLFTCQPSLFLATTNVFECAIIIHTIVPLINLIITGKSQTEALMYWLSDQVPGLRFPCNDWMDEVNKLFITWPFHYGPEPAIN